MSETEFQIGSHSSALLGEICSHRWKLKVKLIKTDSIDQSFTFPLAPELTQSLSHLISMSYSLSLLLNHLLMHSPFVAILSTSASLSTDGYLLYNVQQSSQSRAISFIIPLLTRYACGGHCSQFRWKPALYSVVQLEALYNTHNFFSLLLPVWVQSSPGVVAGECTCRRMATLSPCCLCCLFSPCWCATSRKCVSTGGC